MAPGPPRTPLDIGELIPELAPLRRRATALSSAPGDPGARDSSIGGPMLWPADEPWPHCAEPGHADWSGAQPSRPVPMVPVVQLFARDVPELRFPEGKDVLQLLWCTLIHTEEPCTVLPVLHWRAESETLAAGVLRDIPEPAEGEYEGDFTPRPPCALSPVVVDDYPNWDRPEALRPRIAAAEEEFGFFYTELACVLESKAGGYPAWTQPPDWPSCDRGHRMEHLLSVTGDEHVDMDMGDGGGVYVFLCRECPELPHAHRFDCH
ncbi:hypothetical protein [Streptomyces sp. NPDC014894]|uniref:hypothetical protein n=1 Tax=unclassified Streptomyces TaxID=2593676 RepID=UPI0036FFED0E